MKLCLYLAIEVGREITEALQAAKRGVKCRIMVDSGKP